MPSVAAVERRYALTRALFGDAGEVVGPVLVPCDLRVWLAVRIVQAAVGQFRRGGVPLGQESDPLGQQRHQLIGELVEVETAHMLHAQGDPVRGTRGIHRVDMADAPGVGQFRGQVVQILPVIVAGVQPRGEFARGGGPNQTPCLVVGFRAAAPACLTSSPNRLLR